MATSGLDAQVEALLEREQPTVIHSRWPISEAAVTTWLDVMNYPARSPDPGPTIRAPRAMLYGWTLAGSNAGADRPMTTKERLRRLYAEHAFSAVVATSIDPWYLADLHVGQRVTETVRVEAVSARKQTRLGPGYFVTTWHEFRDDDGRPVGHQRVGGLFFRPEREVRDDDRRPGVAPADHVASDPDWPPHRHLVSTSDIVTAAIATNDYEPVHHDVELARAQGLDGIIMNVLTTAGLVAAYATRRAGPDSVLSRVGLELMSPIYPGVELTFTTTDLDRPSPTSAAAVALNSGGTPAVVARVEIDPRQGQR
jgi:acyl dehydratase